MQALWPLLTEWYGSAKTDHLIKPSRAGFHTVPD